MIPVAKTYLGAEEIAAVSEVIQSGWVTQGPAVAEFERLFADYVGAEHACAVSSCTSALHLGLRAVGVDPGDVVITVSHSFIATANAVRHCGAEPVFIDIETGTYNIDPDLIARCLAEKCEAKNGKYYYKRIKDLIVGESPFCYIDKPRGRVAAILVVHQMGIPCDLRQALQIADDYGIPLVEDAACAVGSEISMDGGKSWERIGKPHGAVACFSFHPRKILTTGDGGMLTTNSEEMLLKFKLWRHHGMSVSDSQRHASKMVTIEQYETTGFNYRMTDIQAAMGVVQLKKLTEHLARRRALADNYYKLLAGKKVCTLPELPDYSRTNWQSFPIELKPGYEAKKIMQFLLENDIATRPGIMNAHEELPYRPERWHLPNSEAKRRQTILLPLYPQMRFADQELIVQHLSRAGRSC